MPLNGRSRNPISLPVLSVFLKTGTFSNFNNTIMAHATTFEDGTPITDYLATAYAEGFCEGENATKQDQLLAWSYLIGTGLYNPLQGWFGRIASNLIAIGVIDKDGTILINNTTVL